MEKIFYNYFFKEISDKEGIPLQQFFHPKNSSVTKNLKYKNMHKTINSHYIANISKSKQFIERFLNYLNRLLYLEYV